MVNRTTPPDDPGIVVEVIEEDAATIVIVNGEVDINTSPVLRQALVPLLGRPGPHTLVFDLGPVRFLDSAGIAVLLSVAQHGLAVLLRNPSDVLTRVIEATGLSHTLRTEP